MVDAQVSVWCMVLMWLAIAVIGVAVAVLCWLIAWRDAPRSTVRQPPVRRRLVWIEGEYREIIDLAPGRALARR